MASEDSKQADKQEPTPLNNTIFQGFEWHCPSRHWNRLEKVVPNLREIGISALWIPPGAKAAGGANSTGYDIMDNWDLGEFDQCGTVPTRWGSFDELKALTKTAKDNKVGIYWDAVLNHRMGASGKEKCRVVRVDGQEKDQGDELEIEAWLGFDFEGRKGKYSDMKWHWYHFSGVDYAADTEEKAVFRILGDGKHFSHSVPDGEDFLMGSDVDYSHPEVIEDTLKWGKWITETLGLSGFRFDAVQHFSQRFTNEFVAMLEKEFGKDSLFLVGEFWEYEVSGLEKWLETMEHKFSLFDAPLLNNFSQAGKTEKADLRKIFDGSLVQVQPTKAVTVVQNHDTQKGQTVETLVEGWMKPLAYALIMLRNQGYPCLFYGDLYGTLGDNGEGPAANGQLGDIVLARYLYAYGQQDDYWDDANCIGFVRHGTWDKPDGLACIMSNAEPGTIRMAVGKMHAGKVFTDVLGWNQKSVTIDEEGFGEFECAGVSVSIYVNEKAEGREKFGKFDTDIYKGEDLEKKE